jgi:hypothetical protein
MKLHRFLIKICPKLSNLYADNLTLEAMIAELKEENKSLQERYISESSFLKDQIQQLSKQIKTLEKQKFNIETSNNPLQEAFHARKNKNNTGDNQESAAVFEEQRVSQH